MKTTTVFFWINGPRSLMWDGSSFSECIVPPDISGKTLVVGGDNGTSRFANAVSKSCLEVITYEDFFAIGGIGSLADAALAIDEANRLLKNISVESARRFTSAIFRKFSKKIWRSSWNRHYLEDKCFLDGEVHPISETKILSSACRPGWSIASIDMNSMFPFILMKQKFMHPGKMEFFACDPPEGKAWFAECAISWRSGLSKEDKVWFANNHPFVFSHDYARIEFLTGLPIMDRRTGPFLLDIEIPDGVDHNFRPWIFSEEVEDYAKYIRITTIRGISSKPTTHPLKTTMAWFTEERKNAPLSITKDLCKKIANVSASSAFKAPATWHDSVQKWRMDEKAAQGVDGVFAYTVLLRAHARRLMFRQMNWMRDNLPAHEIAYINIDSAHFMSPELDECLKIMDKNGLIGVEPGQWKLEWTARHGVWPAPRYYWLRNVTKNGGYLEFLHASLDPSDPYAKGVSYELDGEKLWLSNKSAWKGNRNLVCKNHRFHRLPLDQAIKRTTATYSTSRMEIAVKKLLNRES